MKSHRPATHNRKIAVYRDKEEIAWSGTMKQYRELREDWRMGKLERDIFKQDGASLKTFDDSKWTNRQEEYHKKREEMLDYDSFEEFVSTVSTDHSTPKALVVNPFNTQKYRNAPEEHKDGWKKVKAVVDTGASHFITADPSMLTNQRTSKTMISTAASGGTLQAKSRGTVHMQFDNQARTPFLHTTDAIYSPNCGEETLIPARQVCHNGDLIGVIYNNKIEWHRNKMFELLQILWGPLGWMGRRTSISKKSGLNRMILSLEFLLQEFST